MPREHCVFPEFTGVHRLPEQGPLPSNLTSISYFAWRCLFGVFLIYWFNQSLLNSKVGYFCHQKSAASPPAAFLEFTHRTPQGDGWEWQRCLEPRNANATCHVACSPHPTPHLHMHTGPHTSTCSNMHTHAPVTGVSRATSQSIPPWFFLGPSRTLRRIQDGKGGGLASVERIKSIAMCEVFKTCLACSKGSHL